MRRSHRFGIILWLALTFAHTPQACFPVEDILFDTQWKQMTSLTTYTIMVADSDNYKHIYLKHYFDGVLTDMKSLECVVAHGNNNYLVREDDQFIDNSFYSCMHIEVKTKYILQMKKTDINTARKKISCGHSEYIEDDFIWFANVRHAAVPCPLSGGYQIIISADNIALSSQCVRSLHTFNPRMQFECDNVSSGQAVLDMGYGCRFRQLWDAGIITKRDVIFLRCIGHWSFDATTSLVFQLEENEAHVCCLQYHAIFPDGFTPMYLSVLGYCPSKVFLSNTAMYDSLSTVYGALAPYVSQDDVKCAKNGVDSDCQERNRVCLTSNQCPRVCNRCVKVRHIQGCSIHEKFHGTWKSLSPKSSMLITVGNYSLIGVYGELSCRGSSTVYKNGEVLYELEQVGSMPSCMPFYVCVRLKSLAPGIRFFQFQTVGRIQTTGEPYTCAEANQRWGHLSVLSSEMPMALYDESKLTRTSCNFTDNALYRTSLGSCRLLVEKCVDDCKTLHVEFDILTCSNETIASHPIISEHQCLQTMRFQDNVLAVVTESYLTNKTRYFCLIFSSAHLFVVSPEDCHDQQAKQIVHNIQSLTLYDPVTVLSISHHSETSSACDKHPCLVMALVLVSLTQIFSSFYKNQH